VRIDHAGNAGIAAEVDDFRSRRDFGVGGDGSNPVAFDDDDGVGDDAMAVPEFAEPDGLVAAAAGRAI
jgi:hypothetical protein